MGKKELLKQMNRQWKRLSSAVEGVPDEALEAVALPDDRTIKAACCAFTAWDGEMMRRIGVARGEREPAHDPHDAVYWTAWEDQQISVKSIMPMRGVLVDMVGTRRRLLTLIESLDDETIMRWIGFDPRADGTAFEICLREIEVWREQWNTDHPTGWRRFFRKK